MMGGQTLNGQYQQQTVSAAPPPPPGSMMDVPIAYYTPVAITPNTIKWFMGAMVGIIGFLAASPVAERYLNPAGAKDLDGLGKIVQVIQTSQQEQKLAMERMTMAIDNLSGIVAEIRTTSQKVVPVAKRVLTPRAQ
jgi:hypothetical protein